MVEFIFLFNKSISCFHFVTFLSSTSLISLETSCNFDFKSVATMDSNSAILFSALVFWFSRFDFAEFKLSLLFNNNEICSSSSDPFSAKNLDLNSSYSFWASGEIFVDDATAAAISLENHQTFFEHLSIVFLLRKLASFV